MPDRLLSDRVKRLEKTVEGLPELPATVADLGIRVAAVEAQIVQLRGEMRVEFSAARSEMSEDFAAARDDMLTGLANVTSELRQEIRESAAESRRHSQMLFEDVLGRIAALGERRDPLSPPKKRTPRRKR
jgi:vacuolar-type H+-ATPase subunit H